MHKKGLYERYFKRLLDIICSLGFILCFWWLYILVAVLVKRKLGSPVIFKQQRPGLNGRIFTMYKFRSMTDAKDKDGKLLSDDIRLTKFGRLLRSTSLDELPELINILRGDMAIVGPRPLLIEYLPYYTKEEKHRHDVRPGLTGLAQVSGRNTITWEEKFAFDLEYVNSITLEKDIEIILKTIKKVFKREDILIGKEFKVKKLLVERANWKLTPEGAIRPLNEK